MRVLPGKVMLQKNEVVKKNGALCSSSEFSQETFSNFPLIEVISESFVPSKRHNNEVNQDKPKLESSLKNGKEECAVSLEKDHDDSKREFERERLKEDKVKIRHGVCTAICHVLLDIILIFAIRYLQIVLSDYYQPSSTIGIFFKSFLLTCTFALYFTSFYVLIVSSLSMWQNIAYLKIADTTIKELSV